MSTKKRYSYPNILKQAISEFDTSKTVDIKGPMLDPILSWDGNGELPIYKDAASILERYYFNETADQGVESLVNQDGSESKTPAEKEAKGTGTEQAGTSDAGTMAARKDDIEAGVAKEWLSLFEEDMADAIPEDEVEDEEKKEKKEKVAENLLRLLEAEEDEEKKEEDEEKKEKPEEEAEEKKVDEVAEWVAFLEQEEKKEEKEEGEEEGEEKGEKEVEVTESAIIEKLIEEMEEAGDALPQDPAKKEDEEGMDVDEKVKDEDDKKKIEEALRMIELAMDYEGDGVAPGMEAKDEKEASGPMEDTQGAGTQQAGTGDSEKEIPDRDDIWEDFVEPKNYNEGLQGPGGKFGFNGMDGNRGLQGEDDNASEQKRVAELFGLLEDEENRPRKKRK